MGSTSFDAKNPVQPEEKKQHKKLKSKKLFVMLFFDFN
jgi:hypothetical protein|tara:strand:+ start:338 stop:451 length:114 start_codon:yes stop_codon:yes gene_type:complete